MIGYGNPEGVNCRVGIIDVDVAGMAMKKQIQCNTGPAGIRLQIMPACDAIALHHVRDERREWCFPSGVAQGAI